MRYVAVLCDNATRRIPCKRTDGLGHGEILWQIREFTPRIVPSEARTCRTRNFVRFCSRSNSASVNSDQIMSTVLTLLFSCNWSMTGAVCIVFLRSDFVLVGEKRRRTGMQKRWSERHLHPSKFLNQRSSRCASLSVLLHQLYDTSAIIHTSQLDCYLESATAVWTGHKESRTSQGSWKTMRPKRTI